MVMVVECTSMVETKLPSQDIILAKMPEGRVVLSGSVLAEQREVTETVAFFETQFAIGRMSRRASDRNIQDVLGIPGSR